MIRSFHIAFSLLLIFSSGNIWAQKNASSEAQLKYSNAYELMELGKYGLAMQAFKPLTSVFEGNGYEKMASYYYAVSAYRNDQKHVARDMFLQLHKSYPNWENRDEVSLWLTNIYLDEGDYKNALTSAAYIKDKELIQQVNVLKGNYLNGYNYHQLDSMLNLYSSDKIIATTLADKIIKLPLGEQDREQLASIVATFNLDTSKYRVNEDIKSTKKDKYQVAVLLPFLTEDVKNNTKHLSNEFVIELYEGLLMGEAHLKQLGINITLHPYDTKKDSQTTAQILELDELKFMDLIIGPLFPDPVKLVSDFAFENQINMINPLSSNSEIIGNNPYAFLFMPSTENMAKQAADYVAENIYNKNAMIFHENNPKDSALAYNYKKDIESHGFTTCHIQAVAVEDAKDILDILTNTASIEFDANEFDAKELQQKAESNLRITEKDYLMIQPDSIGHVFVASNSPALVANTITGLETRGDTIQLIGMESWLDQRVISIGGMDRLKTHLIAPTHIDKSNPIYLEINTLYEERFNAYPSKNFYIGYETICTMGKIMYQMGSLFQFDAGINNFVKGEVFQGLLYGDEKSNQYVPIVTFKNSELIVENPKK